MSAPVVVGSQLPTGTEAQSHAGSRAQKSRKVAPFRAARSCRRSACGGLTSLLAGECELDVALEQPEEIGEVLRADRDVLRLNACEASRENPVVDGGRVSQVDRGVE